MRFSLTHLGTVSMSVGLCLMTQSGLAQTTPCTSVKDATPSNIASCTFSNEEKAILLVDWMRDPNVQKDAWSDFQKLAKYLRSLNDPRTGEFVVSLYKEATLSDVCKLVLLQTFGNLPDLRIKEWVLNTIDTADMWFLSVAYKALPVSSGPFDPRITKATIRILSNYPAYDWQTTEVAYKWIAMGLKAAVLPGIDHLRELERETMSGTYSSYFCTQKEAANGGNGGTYFYPSYLDYIGNAIGSMGALKEVRAKEIVTLFAKHRCVTLQKAAQSALGQIELGEKITAIRKVTKTYAPDLSWAFEYIRTHDGNYHSTLMEILGSLEFAAAKNLTAKTQVIAFAKKEYSEGYHIGDEEVQAYLKKLSGI